VSQGSISRWEDDQSEPRASELRRLAAALHTNIRYLITGEGPEGPSEAGEALTYRAGVRSAVMRVRMALEEIEATSDAGATDALALEDQLDALVFPPQSEGRPEPPEEREG
jgi:transcriptional regulator with XRE-family HTH domain